jgi:hypothetical protein
MARQRRSRGVPADLPDQAPAAPRLAFIPVELVGQLAAAPSPADAARPAPDPELAAPQPASGPPGAEVDRAWGERTSLFGDPEG